MESAGSKLRRILIVVQNLPVPLDRRVWLEATTLTTAGYEVSVICPKAKGFDRSYERLEGVDVYRYALPIQANGLIGFVAEFAWCFMRTATLSVTVATRGRGFDVIHACNPPDIYWLLALFWRPFGKKFVFDHHDLSPEMYSAKFGRQSGVMYRGLRVLERLTFKMADVVITTNESHKRIAIERGRVPADKIFVVRSGPDLSRFMRHQCDLRYRKGKNHLLVYLGEICKQDGVDYLVRALKILRDEFSRRDVHCILVGGGPHQPAIRTYADEIGVGELVTFCGRVSDDELCRILSSADIAIDPDPKNDWSDKSTMNKIMEYMYFGLPVVAFDLMETRFSAQNAAVLVDHNSERGMAAEIAKLLDDSGRRKIMGNIGRCRVRQVLAWEFSIPVLLAAYEKVYLTCRTGQSIQRNSGAATGGDRARRAYDRLMDERS